MKKMFFLLAIAGCLLFGACNQSGIDYNPCWSVVASTAEPSPEVMLTGRPLSIFITPDFFPLPFNVLNLSFDGVVSVKSNLKDVNTSIRYNIGCLMEQKPYGKILKVRYLVKDKSDQRVLVILKKYGLNLPDAPEKAEVVKIFDSHDFPASENIQTQSVSISAPANGSRIFDFRNFAYYIEVLFIKTKAGPIPGPIPLPPVHEAPAVGSVSICDPDIVIL